MRINQIVGTLLRSLALEWVVLAGLLVLAASLRLHDYGSIPTIHESADELAFVWSGWSWLHEGAPTAWSEKPAYGPVPVYVWNGARFPLATPWFDHPPLFSLLVGVAVSVAGAPDLMEASLAAARLVAIALGVVAVALLYLLARRAYGRLVAILAAALLATVPTIVVASRLAVPESLIVVCLLGALLATRRYVEMAPAGRGWLALAIVLAAAAGLAKVPGLTVGVSVVLALLVARRWRAAGAAAAGALLGLAPYFLYGLLTNPGLFRAVFFSQTTRATGLDVLPNLLVNDVSVPVAWPDAWFVFLWLALAYATFRRDKLLPVAVAPYLIFLIAGVSHDDLRAPYREPLFPFLCLAGGIFLRDAIAQPDVLKTALVVFGVAFGKVSQAFDGWAALGRVDGEHRTYPFIVAALAAPSLAALVWPGHLANRVAGGVVVGALLVAVAANVGTIAREDDLYPLPRPPIVVDRAVPTDGPVDLASFRVEPDTVAPGGTLRLWTTWLAKRDASGLPESASLRPFDRRTHSYGAPRPLGEPASLTVRAGAPATSLFAGELPPDLPVGDYDLGVNVGPQRVDVGIIRVRTATSEVSETQTVGMPTVLGNVVAVDQALIEQPRVTVEGTVYAIGLRLRALQPLETAYKVFVHLESADGRVVAQSDSLPGGGLRTQSTSNTLDDWRDLVLPPTTPPGRYYLSAGMYEPASGQRLHLASGEDQIRLGLIEVGRPMSESDVPHRLGSKLEGGIDLVGYDLQSKAGNQYTLTLYWRASGVPPRDYTVFVHVLDADGQLRTQADGPPDHNRVPTSTWRPGQIIPDAHDLSLAGLPAGPYKVQAGLYLAPNGPRLAVAGSPDGSAEVAVIPVG